MQMPSPALAVRVSAAHRVFSYSLCSPITDQACFTAVTAVLSSCFHMLSATHKHVFFTPTAVPVAEEFDSINKRVLVEQYSPPDFQAVSDNSFSCAFLNHCRSIRTIYRRRRDPNVLVLKATIMPRRKRRSNREQHRVTAAAASYIIAAALCSPCMRPPWIASMQSVDLSEAYL